MALIVSMGAASGSAYAAGKKKKTEEKVPETKTLTLATASDSISYAAGMRQTDGLLPFIKQQFEVDTAYMADFIKGYEDMVGSDNADKARAYAAGQQIALTVKKRMLPLMKADFKERTDSITEAMFHEGLLGALRNDASLMTVEAAKDYFDTRLRRMTEERSAANREAGEKFLAENKTKEGVVTLPSGLQYKVLTEGSGDIATETDDVTVKYEGRLIDGTVFDSSYKRAGGTSKFKPTQVIKGWTEALTMMPVGSKWELYIPQELAYGDKKTGNIEPYSALIFTVEVVAVGGVEPKGDATKPSLTPVRKTDAKVRPSVKKGAAGAR